MATQTYQVVTYTAKGRRVEGEYAAESEAAARAAGITRATGRRADVATVRTPAPRVCVTRCAHCGDEVYGYAPATGECPRCSRPESQRYGRWIGDPHPDTTRRAKAGVAI